MKYLKTYNQINLEINENQLIKDHLNDTGEFLDIGGLNITELPELPETIKTLFCDRNKLTKLPELPKGLINLYCYNNNLTELPELPEGLELLDCEDNKLTELPELPKTLQILGCRNNKLPYTDIEGYWEWFYKKNPDLQQANKLGLY